MRFFIYIVQGSACAEHNLLITLALRNLTVKNALSCCLRYVMLTNHAIQMQTSLGKLWQTIDRGYEIFRYAITMITSQITAVKWFSLFVINWNFIIWLTNKTEFDRRWCVLRDYQLYADWCIWIPIWRRALNVYVVKGKRHANIHTCTNSLI